MKRKVLFLIASFLAVGLWSFAADGGGKYGSPSSSRSSSSSSSSRSSFGGSSSSRSSFGGSSSSRSSFGSSFGGSSSSSRSGGGSSGSSRYGSSSSKGFSNPSAAVKTPSGDSKRPTSGGFSSPYKTTTDSRRPTTVVNDKITANREEVSRKKYEATQKAVAPPKPSYTASNGQTVKIDNNSKTVATIRNKPSTYHQPEVRDKRVVEHIHTYHYQHDYGWYRSRPYVYCGPYDSAFWWMMMEWDADRRARWLYNHQSELAHTEAYKQALQNAELRGKIAELERQKTAQDPQYVDPEFKDNPTDMYDHKYVEAAYNPVVVQQPAGASCFVIVVWTIIAIALVSCIFLAATRVRLFK